MKNFISYFGGKKLLLILPIILLAASCNKQPAQNSSAPTSGQQQTPPVGETSNWKTYSNEQYGFEIKYPKVWGIVEKLNNGANFADLSDPKNLEPRRFSVYRTSSNPEGSIRDVNEITKTEQTTVNGIVATKMIGASGVTGIESVFVVVNKNGEYFVLSTPPDIFDQILSTFKFTNPTAQTSSEDSTQKVFNSQPGSVNSIKIQNNGQWILAVDLLSQNPHWLPGVDSTGGFFINQNTKIRNLTVTKDTKTYNCGGDPGNNNGGKASLLVSTSSFISQIQIDINTGYYRQYGGPVRYLDINGSNITAMYDQCLP